MLGLSGVANSSEPCEGSYRRVSGDCACELALDGMVGFVARYFLLTAEVWKPARSKLGYTLPGQLSFVSLQNLS